MSLPLLCLQKAPLAGLLAGSGVALGLWILGKVVESLGWQRLGWFYQDPSLLWGGLWLGLGLGLMVRINTLYPNLPTSLRPAGEAKVTLLEAPVTLPVKGQPRVFRGKLLGSRGLANSLCQALYLDCETGMIKLEVPFPVLHLPGLRHPNDHPADWAGRTVTVLGWQRRGGGLLWLDVQEIHLEPSRRFRSHTPIWMTLLSLSLSLCGIAIIFTGG
ncbi:MAG: hypothetical protein HC922_00340 [Leptolyngbyaceae cyanobacterium SM2_3_12]|nr:hypothetical protein [Leptolyngbyaceae cyanobacterium SM2_3_12]